MAVKTAPQPAHTPATDRTVSYWARYRDESRALEVMDDIAFVVGVEGPGSHETRKKFAAFIRSIKERVSK